MYPLGILFGLGFDTSSEIALLGISSIEAAKGTSFWVILILPALFTGAYLIQAHQFPPALTPPSRYVSPRHN
jgi:High-affinity nickel permease